MRSLDTLAEIGPRRACTDAERRAAKALAAAARALGRRPRTQTVWVRPQWPSIWLAHAVLGLAGALLTVESPIAGTVVLGLTAVSALGELTARLPLLSLLWPRRATQDVVAPAHEPARVVLVVTAATDAPPALGPLSSALAALDAGLASLLRGRLPHPLALLTLALVVLTGLGGALVAGVDGIAIAAAQLTAVSVCLVAAAVLAELALAGPVEGGDAAASAPAAALALVAALDERPPRRLAVELVLAGAAHGPALGLRAYIRENRRPAEEVAVLHLEPCGAPGVPLRCWTHDGPLLRAALHPRLVALAQEAGALPHRGRGFTGAYAARRVGWPAVALGRPGRAGAGADPAQVDETVAAALELVRRLDRELG